MLVTLNTSVTGSFSMSVMTQQNRRDQRGGHSGICCGHSVRLEETGPWTLDGQLHEGSVFPLWSLLSPQLLEQGLACAGGPGLPTPQLHSSLGPIFPIPEREGLLGIPDDL